MKKYLILAAVAAMTLTVTSAFAKNQGKRALVCQGEVSTQTSKGPFDDSEPVIARLNLKADFKLNRALDPNYPTAVIDSELEGTRSIRVIATQAPDRDRRIFIQFEGGYMRGEESVALSVSNHSTTSNTVISKHAFLECALQ